MLPDDCNIYYISDFISETDADALYRDITENYDVANKITKMADGTEYIGQLGTFVFCDEELTSYDALHPSWGEMAMWSEQLYRVREQIEQRTGIRFQVARCVFYRDGTDFMDYHQDMPAYGCTKNIASLSLGAERSFAFKSIENPEVSYHHQLTWAVCFLWEKAVRKNTSMLSRRIIFVKHPD